MILKDVMNRQVETISPEVTLREAARKMDEINIGALLVCDGDRIIGIITDRDIVIRSVSEGLDVNTTRVRDSMTSPIVYAYDDQTVDDAVQIMEKEQVRRLPILNRDKRLVGIVSISDIATETADQKLVGEVLRKVTIATKPAA